MYKITLLRHGESAGNANGQIQGQSDPPLTENGIGQARNLAKCWGEEDRRYDRIISSPLIRARVTAEIVAVVFGLPVEYDPAWIERGFGSIEGQNFAELLSTDPSLDINQPYLAPGESGESIVDLYHRASSALQNLLRRPAGAYLVVSHGAMINLTLYAILGISPHNSPVSPRFIIQNTGFIDLLYDPTIRQWRILRFSGNDTSFP